MLQITGLWLKWPQPFSWMKEKMMKRLAGKTALITGAASIPGLGSATAFRFAEEGAQVFLTDINEAGSEAVASTIRASGGHAVSMRHDVTSSAEWDLVFSAVEKEFGGLDIMVNNAGIAILGPFADITDDAWMRQNQTNLHSVFFGTQRAVKLMRKGGKGGSIINMSSVAGLIGVAGCAAYAASKGGVRLFSKSVALECAMDKIRVNTVHPGMIMTNIQKVAMQENPEVYKSLSASIPMGHFGEPEDVANMNLFLASDESRYVTGAEFVIDGGLVTV
jgi:NAD(P)-dependent dehydrogenase (short-subunit alcohol dehydrogenase family)